MPWAPRWSSCARARSQAQYGVHREIIGGGWLKLARGQVTDDTTMSLALGGALLQGGRTHSACMPRGDDTLVHSIGQAFVQWLQGKPVDCGNTCRRGILRYLHEHTLAGPYNPGDAGNGALMRNLPVVLATLGDDAAFARLSIAQAHLTHHHPLSDAATLGMGQLLRLLLHGVDHSECQHWVRAVDHREPGLLLHPLPWPRHRLCGGHGADRVAFPDAARGL